MTGDPGAMDWGCRLDGLDMCRMDDDGRVSFKLSISETLVIPAGRGFAPMLPVMGRSGAGKSTLMNVLSGTSFPAPDTASVHWSFPNGDTFELRGDSVASAALNKVRGRYFGYAFQQPRLLAHLTVRENLVFSRVNIGDNQKTATERARELMLPTFGENSSEVDRIMDLYPAQLSGGEKQRVALLQAIVRDPYVLFADEPTGSLDRDTRKEVMQLLRNWVVARKDERLLIWVTHHDRDPFDSGAFRRLWVADGMATFEETDDGERWNPCAREMA